MGMKKYKMDYIDYLSTAADSGFDWENEPPPKKYITEELCIAALQDAWQHLAKLPEKMKTFAVCFAAVYQDEDALSLVPPALREQVKQAMDVISEDRWLADLKWYTGNHYRKLHKRLLTPEFLHRMVSVNAQTIRLVPHDMRTRELRGIAFHADHEPWMQFFRGDDDEPGPLVMGGTAIVMRASWSTKE